MYQKWNGYQMNIHHHVKANLILSLNICLILASHNFSPFMYCNSNVKKHVVYFLLGPMYMMTPKTSLRLLDLLNTTLKQDYIWIENIYLTGILRQKLNFSLVDIGKQFIKNYETNTSFMAAHLDYLNPKERIQFWKDNVQ